MAFRTPQENKDFIQLVARAALAQSRHLLTTWPETAGGKVMNREYFVSNPTRDDRNPTNFSVNIDTGEWSDLAMTGKGNGGGDLVSLYAYIKGIRHQIDAAKLLATELGMGEYTAQEVERVVATLPPPKPIKEKPKPTYPAVGECPHSVIESYAKWFSVNKAEGAPVEITRQFRYLDSEGRLMGLIVRMDYELNGKPEKITPPFFCFDGKWKAQGPTGLNNKPLFGLEQLAQKPDAPVLVVEGEKCALYGQDNVPDYAVVSWMGGVKGVKYADWSPLFGRNIVIWPDHDKEGMEAAKQIRSIVKGRVLKIPDSFPKKWDIADATLDEIAEILNPSKGEKKAPTVYENMIADNSFYTVKGYSKDGSDRFYHFYNKEIMSLETLSHAGLFSNDLTRLAPWEFWDDRYQSAGGNKTKVFFAAANDLIRECTKTYYDPSDLCGLGAWVDPLSPSGYVFHAGDRLIIDRNTVTGINDTTLANCYERRKSVKVADEELTTAEADEFLQILSLLNFSEPSLIYVLAGWIFLAPMCCALTWRPHIYIHGGRGSGKSWVLQKIVSLCLHGFNSHFEGGSTEPGIRQSAGIDAMPILIDEVDNYGKTDEAKNKNINGLSRESSSSTGGIRARGTATGKALAYKPRWMFCYSSIFKVITEESDTSRSTSIKMVAGIKDAECFEEAQARHAKLVAQKDFAPRLLRRTVNNMARVIRLIPLFVASIEKVIHSRRNSDQIGTLAAGLWCLTRDEDPNEADLCTITAIFAPFAGDVSTNDREYDKVLQAIIEEKIGYGDDETTILDCIKNGAGTSWGGVNNNTRLGIYGIKIKDNYVYFAPKHKFIIKMIDGKSFSGVNYIDALKAHPDAQTWNTSFGSQKNGSVVKGRAVGIPTSYVLSLDPFKEETAL